MDISWFVDIWWTFYTSGYVMVYSVIYSIALYTCHFNAYFKNESRCKNIHVSPPEKRFIEKSDEALNTPASKYSNKCDVNTIGK